MDKEFEELKSVNSNLDYACSVIQNRKITSTHSKNDLEDCVNIQIDFDISRRKRNNQSLNNEESSLSRRISPHSVKQLPYNNLLKNIHQLTGNFNQNKPMNIILTTNNNVNTGDEEGVDESEENVLAQEQNDSCSTNDSLLDKELGRDEDGLANPADLTGQAQRQNLVDEINESSELPPAGNNECDIDPKEYELYKRDILNELKKDKKKLEEEKFAEAKN